MSNRLKLRKNLQRLNAACQDQDATYFNAHPYERLATPDELRAGLPVGTKVGVLLVGNRRIRAFVSPDERQN